MNLHQRENLEATVEKKPKNNPVLVSAQLNKLRIAPRKVRLVCDLVRHLPPSQAITVLENTPKRAAPAVSKLISSAIANALHNLSASYDQLFIKEIFVNEGRTLKRFRPRARGVTYPILKRSSRVKVILGIKPPAVEEPTTNGTKN